LFLGLKDYQRIIKQIFQPIQVKILQVNNLRKKNPNRQPQKQKLFKNVSERPNNYESGQTRNTEISVPDPKLLISDPDLQNEN